MTWSGWARLGERVGVGWLLLAIAGVPGRGQPGAAEGDRAMQQVVDGLMKPFLAETQAPGAIVGISLHGKRSFYIYGQATDDGRPFTPTTLVEIGSCTKVFTTTLFALEIGRGQIRPDGSVQQYMPRGYKLQPEAQAMTPRELANFTSGLPDNATDLPRQLEMRGIGNYTEKDFFHWLGRWKPSGPLPAPYEYSNAGTGLLGYVVQDVAGVPWERLLQQEVTGPLGMVDTETRPSGEQIGRLAQGHRANGTAAPPWPYFAWFAAGALRSTATDMLRFGEANLGHGTVDGKTVAPQLTAAMKMAQTPTYTLPNGEAQQGMAWVTNMGQQPGFAPETLKNGGTVGFGSVILLNPKKDLAIFIVVNQQESKPAPIAVRMGRMLR